MLRLLLLRHSKAVARVPGGDVKRPLNRRGQRDALRIGEYLSAEGIIPDLAVTSHARRAKETLDGALQGLARSVTIIKNKRIYLAEPATLLDVLREAPTKVSTVLFVGHNPGLAAFANELAGSGDAQARAAMAAHFPTTALAVLDFDLADWEKVDFGKGKLDRFVTPASLGDEEEE